MQKQYIVAVSFLVAGCLLSSCAERPTPNTVEPPATDLKITEPTPKPVAKIKIDDGSSWADAMLKLAETHREAVAKGNLPIITRGGWHRTKQFTNVPFENRHFPEEGVELSAKDKDGAALWKKFNYTDGKVHLFNGQNNGTTYIYHTLSSSAKQEQVLNFGSDDSIEVWLNQKQILRHKINRAARPDQEIVKANLRKGDNTLLLKIHNGAGPYGFYFRIGGDVVQGHYKEMLSQYPVAASTLRNDLKFEGFAKWLNSPEDTMLIEEIWIKNITSGIEELCEKHLSQYRELLKRDGTGTSRLKAILALSRTRDNINSAKKQIGLFNEAALRRAILDLSKRYPDKFNGEKYLSLLGGHTEWATKAKQGISSVELLGKTLDALKFKKEILLDNNPAIDFENILLIKRHTKTPRQGLVANWQANSSLPRRGWNDELAMMSVKNLDAPLVTLYKPKRDVFVGDYDLHFDADKVLFSSLDENYRWGVFEVKLDGTGLRQISKSDGDMNVDNFDPVYLADDRIIYASTANYQGVPCVSGGDYVSNLHLVDSNGEGARRLTFDQDNSWFPTLLPNGRVMYLRWEYTDSAHYFSRILMNMNPDGTDQKEYYGSNSYWPNSVFFARPIPNKSNQFVSVVTGHHGVARMGELFIFDVSKGRKSDNGVVQQMPGWGKPFKGIIKDRLVDGSWPKFLHPYPIDENNFLVACKMTSSDPWGIYLIDRFDNMLKLRDESNYLLQEPVPLRKTARPHIIPDKVNLSKKDSTVYIQDVYQGGGLRGVPRGSVKKLRVFHYDYAYRNMGGHYAIGFEGPWDVRHILGTVDVNPDGSAIFKIPANTPIALQPLDEEGKALQQMRSWFVGMPNETVSCIGCHESQNDSPSRKPFMASRQQPQTITPWRGPRRGFSYVREVQPVLDRNCIGCHNADTPERPNLMAQPKEKWTRVAGVQTKAFPPSYMALHPYVRRNGPEGDYNLLTPAEFHADTSELVQMLKKNHHGVKLSEEDWDRLITWIDLNVPAHGSWSEVNTIPANYAKNRKALLKKYAGIEIDYEKIESSPDKEPVAFQNPKAQKSIENPNIELANWPLSAAQAKQLQTKAGDVSMTLELAEGVTMDFVRIPSGVFVMGNKSGARDEQPICRVEIKKPFWMAKTEVTLAQYRAFNSGHINGYYDMHYKDQVKPGYNMDADISYPAIRVSWNDSIKFCDWLKNKSGKNVTLPTEAQWEWACRAGSSTAMSYGEVNSNFEKNANLADVSLKKMAVIGVDPKPMSNPPRHWDFIPQIKTMNDNALHLAKVGSYAPNAWGLFDMHGNVCEWTLSALRSYPYQTDDERSNINAKTKHVVRGGSWRDRPHRASSSFRLEFPAWQQVYNVGFRPVILE